MKNFKQECKSFLSILLVVMLVFTMLITCSGITAGADEAVVFPDSLNMPSLVFSTLSKSDFNYRFGDYGYISFNEKSSDKYMHPMNLQTIAIALDDTECDANHKLSQISSVSFAYNDSESGMSFSDTAKFYVVEDFDTVLVKVGFETIASHFASEVESDGDHYLYYSDYRNMVDSLRRAEAELTVAYADGSSQNIPVAVAEDNAYESFDSDGNYHSDNSSYLYDTTSKENPTNIYFYYSGSTTSMLLLKLPHCKNIDNNTFMKLESALFAMEEEDSTNKYYVDADSDKDIIIPMTNMSNMLELVQTRVGDDIIYNAYNSADFGENKISAVSDGQSDNKYGRVFTVRRNSRVCTAAENNLIDFANWVPYESAWLELDGELFSSRKLVASDDNYNKDLTREEFLNSEKNQLCMDVMERGYKITYKNNRGYDFNSDSRYGCYNYLYIEPNTVKDANQLFNALHNLTQSKDIYDTDEGCLSMTGTTKNGSRYTDSGFGYERPYIYISGRTSNGEHRGYSFYFSNSSECERFKKIFSSFTSIDYLEIQFYSCNGEPCEKIMEVLNDLNISLSGRYESNYCDFSSETKIPISSYFDITEETGPLDYYINDYVNGAGSGYDSAKYDNVIDSVKRSTEKVITDTYDGNEVRFSPSALTTCEKGIAYNIVNQVMIASDGFDDCLGAYDTNGNWITKGSVYYLDGENITSAITGTVLDAIGEYNNYQAAQKGIMRHTEYKWGELVLASKPDAVKNLAYTESKDGVSSHYLSWTKPADEGLGVTKDGKSRTDDYVSVDKYNLTITDKDGNKVYTKSVPNNGSDEALIEIPYYVIEEDKVYTATVTAENVLGSSKASTVEMFISKPAVEITMTPDQPAYRETDTTVTYTETVTNTGNTTLTDVTINQSTIGEYDKQPDMKLSGTSVEIPDLKAGESYTLTYRVPVSSAVDGKVVNTAEVTTAEAVSDEKTSIVYIMHPDILFTKEADSDTYIDNETVTYTETITNTGDYPFTNVTVTEDNGCGEFVVDTSDMPDKKIEVTSENALLISDIQPGESVTLTYKISAKDIITDEDGMAVSVAEVDMEFPTDIDVKAAVEFKILSQKLSVSASSSKEIYGDNEDIIFNNTVANTGMVTLHDVVVSESIANGTYQENSKGSVNENGEFVIDELKPGESVELVYVIKPEAAPVKDGFVDNTVAVACREGVDASDSTKVQIVHYGITVIKLVDRATHIAGENTVFTTIVKNTGNYDLTNIVVTEDLNGEFVLSNGAAIINNAVVISKLRPDESYSYDYVVPYSSDIVENGTLTSVSTAVAGESVTTPTGETVSGSDSNSTIYLVPEISIEKSAEEKTYKVGDTITYTDSITNKGECDLTNVVVTESQNGTFETEYEATENTVTIPSIAIGETVTLKFTSVIEEYAVVNHQFTCTAEVTTAQNVTTIGSHTVNVEVNDISVSKYTAKDIYESDETITYIDVIANKGDVTLTDVMVTENLSGEFTEYPENCTVSGNKLTISELKPGKSVTVKYNVNISDTDITDGILESTITVETQQGMGASVTKSVTIIPVVDTDTQSDTDTESESDTQTDSEIHSDTSTDTESESDFDTSTDSDTDTTIDNSDTETDTDKVTDTDTESDTESDTDTSVDTDTDTGTETDSDTVTDTDTESDTDTDSDILEQPYMVGDINCDGRITVADATIAQKASLNLVQLSEVGFAAGDVNHDDKVSIYDAVEILKHSVGIVSHCDIGAIRKLYS